MKRFAIWIVSVVVLSALVHIGTVWSIPRLIMSRVMTVVAGSTAPNVMLNQPRPDDKARTVVRPSPDLAYSVCALDLSKGAVHVVVPLSTPYTSVALYSAATDNFFVRNDRETNGAPLDLVVVGKGQPMPTNLPPVTTLVESPTSKALVLVRRVIESDASFPALDQLRQTASCSLL